MDNSYCMRRYASESIQLACKYGYEGVKSGETLSGMYCLLISIFLYAKSPWPKKKYLVRKQKNQKKINITELCLVSVQF